MNNIPLLRVQDVSNVYVKRGFGFFGKPETKIVLNHFNLEMRPGEILGLTGVSGCGKTTLAHCILKLINYQGEIFLDGRIIKRNPLQVQMVFQDPGEYLNPVKKTGWLLEEPLIIHNIAARKERSLLVDRMLSRVGLDPSYKSRKVHELSGGQKQRLCIARALILQPRLLIADEAISSLDVLSGAQILNLFQELHNSLQLDILFISHNINAVEYLCDRVVTMEQ
jgi:ABC-type dipeptide/oligopeptide/nickel transport system ATPase subunit